MSEPWCLCARAGTCIGCLIEAKVQDAYGAQGLRWLQGHLAPTPPTAAQLAEIAEEQDLELTFCVGFDDAIIGLCRIFNDTVVAYDRAKCIEILMQDGQDYDQAVEYFEYNCMGAYVGSTTPAFIERVEA